MFLVLGFRLFGFWWCSYGCYGWCLNVFGVFTRSEPLRGFQVSRAFLPVKRGTKTCVSVWQYLGPRLRFNH